MKAYLGGKMRGVPFWNVPAFEEATEDLRLHGWDIFSPVEHDKQLGMVPPADGQGDFSLLGACLDWDFARIAESDAVIFLPGWETSTGVHWEMTVAYALGKKILSYPSMADVVVPRFISHPTETQTGVPHPTEEFRAAGFHDTGDITQVKWTANPSPTGEVRVVDPKTGAEKGQKLCRTDLLPPDVLEALADHYGRGAQKYADRNWEGGYAWSLSYAAMVRHLLAWWGGEDTITDDPLFEGVSHLDAVVWHAVALRAFELREIGTDDRPEV